MLKFRPEIVQFLLQLCWGVVRYLLVEVLLYGIALSQPLLLVYREESIHVYRAEPLCVY